MCFQVFFVVARKGIKGKCYHTRSKIYNTCGFHTRNNHKSCGLDIFQRNKIHKTQAIQKKKYLKNTSQVLEVSQSQKNDL